MGEVRVFELPIEAWISGFTLVSLLLLILYIAALIRIGRLRRRLNRFLNSSEVAGLESVIANLHAKVDKMQGVSADSEVAVTQLQKKTARLKGNVAVIRYNAFAEKGSDLSFSAAFVDDESSGVVISSIHSRGDSIVYAKPVVKGDSPYALSPEEKEVIRQAIQGKES
jgi:hypothetical protein